MVDILPILRNILQYVLLTFLLLNIALTCYGLYMHRFRAKGYVWPVLLWTTHAIVFYIYVGFFKAPGLSEVTTTWSFGLRSHLILTITFALIYEVFIDYRIRHEQ